MDYLWAPWRSTYMEAKRDKSRCIFCQAASSNTDEETLVIYRGTANFVILNRYPYSTGHLMVTPFQHVSRLRQVDEAASDEMMRLARFAETALEEIYRPDGLNLGMNLGEAAGAGIEQHIHLHVLPRWKGDANFMTTVGHTRIMPEALADTYAKLKQAFSRR